jgi:hypothetical protein
MRGTLLAKFLFKQPIFSAQSSTDRESVLMPYLEALAQFRESVRAMAREQKNTNILKVVTLFL